MGAILNVIAASGGFSPVTNRYYKIAAVSGSGNGTTVTLNFNNSIGTAIPSGRSITVAGSSVSAWNGTWTVTGGNTTSVQFAQGTSSSLVNFISCTVDASGSGTETVPTGATNLIISMYGAGGSGVYTTGATGGAGGGGGAQITSTSLSVSSGQTITYAVGMPGVGNTASPGTAGGNTTVTFTSVFVAAANGGGGGTGTATGGAAGTASVSTGTATSSNNGTAGTAGAGGNVGGNGGAAGTGGTLGGATATYGGGQSPGNNFGGGSSGANLTNDTFAAAAGGGYIAFSYT